jgi:hypothetical protein
LHCAIALNCATPPGAKLKDAGQKTGSYRAAAAGAAKKESSPLGNCARDGIRTTVQMMTDVASQVIKDDLFHRAVVPRPT